MSDKWMSLWMSKDGWMSNGSCNYLINSKVVSIRIHYVLLLFCLFFFSLLILFFF